MLEVDAKSSQSGVGAPTVKTLFIMNDPLGGTERAYNATYVASDDTRCRRALPVQ
jgi:hypothetical protein